MNQTVTIEKLPRTRDAIKDMVIAGAFIAMGVLMPGGMLDNAFQVHIGGIALGMGFGWLVKSIICHKTKPGVNHVGN